MSIYFWTSFQLLPNLIIASINFLCSSLFQRPIELPVSSSINLFFCKKVSCFFGDCLTILFWLWNILNKLHGILGGILILHFWSIFVSIFGSISSFLNSISILDSFGFWVLYTIWDFGLLKIFTFFGVFFTGGFFLIICFVTKSFLNIFFWFFYFCYCVSGKHFFFEMIKIKN